MPTHDESDETQVLFDEAVAMYEAAKAEFEAFQRVMRERLKSYKFVSVSDLNKEELARVNLLHARQGSHGANPIKSCPARK